jgi:Protein of unknown function (DUF559)
MSGVRRGGGRQGSGMNHPRPLPSSLSGVPSFTVSEARAAGVSVKRLRGTDLSAPFHGVRVVGAVSVHDVETRCRTYALRMRDCEVFSHATAALLHGLPVPLASNRRIDVSALQPHGVPRTLGVRGHRLAVGGADIELVRGLRVVSAVDAWCQLGSALAVRDLIVIGDGLVRRQHPLATVGDLVSAGAQRGRRGAANLRAAAEAVRAGTDSPAETELRLDLIAFGLPEPEVNVAIHDSAGRRIAIGDLVYARYRVLVEYDGDQHRRDPRQYARDVDRLDDLARAGWRVVRFNRSHRGIRRRERLERVREALLGAGWTPGSH